MLHDLVTRRLFVARKQSCGLHNLTGLAVTALRHLLGDLGFLKRMITIRRKTFNRGDLFASNIGQSRLTRKYSLAVDMHRAGPAEPRTAAEFRPGHFKMFTQSPEQRRIIAGTDVLRFSVYGKSNYGRISPHLSYFRNFFHNFKRIVLLVRQKYRLCDNRQSRKFFTGNILN
jgi:hypothetical protein